MTLHLDDDYRPRPFGWHRLMRFALYGLLGLMVVCVGVLLLAELSAGPQPDAAASLMTATAIPATASSPAVPLTGQPSPTAPPLPTPTPVGPALELQALQSQLRDVTATLTALQTATAQARAQLNARVGERKAVPAMSRSAPAHALPPSAEPASPPAQQAFVNDAGRSRVVIHYRAGSAAGRDEAGALARRLLFSAFLYGETRTVAAAPAAPTIRYFFPEDAAAALHLAALLRGIGEEFRVESMTVFRPAPARGMLEVWVSR